MGGAGSRDQRIEIQTATKSQDSLTGEESLTWTTMFRIWAKVRQPTGSEVFRAEQRVSKVDAIFNIRHRDDITPNETSAILYKDKRYDITAVLPPLNAGRRTELDVYGYTRAE